MTGKGLASSISLPLSRDEAIAVISAVQVVKGPHRAPICWSILRSLVSQRESLRDAAVRTAMAGNGQTQGQTALEEPKRLRDLPPEILQMIMGHLKEMKCSRSLLSLMRSNKELHELGVPVLYRSFDFINATTDSERIRKLLEVADNKFQHVKKLVIDFIENKALMEDHHESLFRKCLPFIARLEISFDWAIANAFSKILMETEKAELAELELTLWDFPASAAEVGIDFTKLQIPNTVRHVSLSVVSAIQTDVAGFMFPKLEDAVGLQTWELLLQDNDGAILKLADHPKATSKLKTLIIDVDIWQDCPVSFLEKLTGVEDLKLQFNDLDGTSDEIKDTAGEIFTDKLKRMATVKNLELRSVETSILANFEVPGHIKSLVLVPLLFNAGADIKDVIDDYFEAGLEDITLIVRKSPVADSEAEELVLEVGEWKNNRFVFDKALF